MNSDTTNKNTSANEEFDIDRYNITKGIRRARTLLIITTLILAIYIILQIASTIVALVMPPLAGLITFAILFLLECGVIMLIAVGYTVTLVLVCKMIKQGRKVWGAFSSEQIGKNAIWTRRFSIICIIATVCLFFWNIVELVLSLL